MAFKNIPFFILKRGFGHVSEPEPRPIDESIGGTGQSGVVFKTLLELEYALLRQLNNKAVTNAQMKVMGLQFHRVLKWTMQRQLQHRGH